MSGPPQEPPPHAEPIASRDDLVIVEAGQSRERACADCGRRTEDWKPIRRRGTSAILCHECAAKSPPSPPTSGEGCPSCGAALRREDRFCGKCGSRIEYACPACGAAVDAEDVHCGRCGGRLA